MHKSRGQAGLGLVVGRVLLGDARKELARPVQLVGLEMNEAQRHGQRRIFGPALAGFLERLDGRVRAVLPEEDPGQGQIAGHAGRVNAPLGSVGLGLEGDLGGAKLNGSNQLYGLSIPQFYAEFGLNNLSVKVGRMTGILGYEIVPPMGNFFYSHSYAMCYAEPVLITGVMGKYAVSDRMAMFAGFHQGVHRFEDNNGRLNYQSGVMWTAPGGRTSVAYAFDLGRNDAAAVEDEAIHSLVIKQRISSRLLYVIQSDIVQRDNVAALAGQDAETYGINQYLLYTLNPQWAVGMRYEWFRDDDGTAVLGLNNLPGARGWADWDR